MKSKVELITPEKAIKLLGTNVINRKLKIGRIQCYATRMKHGEWTLSTDPIVISVTNHVMNGQHRLWAVIKSNTPQYFLIASEAEEEVMEYIDGGSSRSFADRFYLSNKTLNQSYERKNLCSFISATKCFFAAPSASGSFRTAWTVSQMAEAEMLVGEHINFALDVLSHRNATKIRNSGCAASVARARYFGIPADILFEFGRVFVDGGDSDRSAKDSCVFVRATRRKLEGIETLSNWSMSSTVYYYVTRAIDCFVKKTKLIKVVPTPINLYPLDKTLLEFYETTMFDTLSHNENVNLLQRQIVNGDITSIKDLHITHE